MTTRLGVLALALLALPALAAGAQDATFPVPPLEFGARAEYRVTDGPDTSYVNVTVGPDARVLNRAGQESTVYQLFLVSGRLHVAQHLSAHSMLLERADLNCLTMDEAGACDPWVLHDWYVHNAPGLFGASALQGRSLRVGDAWRLEADCPSCATAFAFRVEPPTASSPPGTRYTVVITGGHAQPYSPAWLMPRGRLHMGTDHAFPLMIEHPWMQGAATLARAVPGQDDLPSEGFAPTRYDPVLQPAPFEAGYPAEGEPVPGWPSWRSAREATGTDNSGVGTFHSVALRKSATRVLLPGDVAVEPEADYAYEERWIRPGQDDLVTTYWANRTLLTGVTRPLTWSAAASTASNASPGCAVDTVPLFDGVRYALRFREVLTGAHGVDLLVHDCREQYLTVTGWAGEELTLDARTGLFLFSWDRAG